MALPKRKDSVKIKSTIKARMTTDYTNQKTYHLDSKIIINKALYHHQKNELDIAAQLYDQALCGDQKNVKLLYLRGLLCIDLKEYQKGVDLLSFAVSQSPNDPLLLNGLADAHRANKNFTLALSCYNKSLNLNPNSIETLYKKGSLLFEQKDEENAITALNEVVKLEPTFFQAYDKLAQIHANRKEKVIEKYYLKLFQYYLPETVKDNFINSCDLYFLNAKLPLHPWVLWCGSEERHSPTPF
ncbi:MAG: tetratricopeptide repeat protein [Magnetococcales bacterium]|nr:tetratricopeptide repeat protein [Magnetococcales bacterium]